MVLRENWKNIEYCVFIYYREYLRIIDKSIITIDRNTMIFYGFLKEKIVRLILYILRDVG